MKIIINKMNGIMVKKKIAVGACNNIGVEGGILNALEKWSRASLVAGEV
jgi:hypothetical protein